MRRTTRAFAQWNFILAHLQHSKFDIVYTRDGQTFSTEGHIEDFIATEGRMLVLHILHLQSLWKQKALHELPQDEGNTSYFRLSKNAVSNEICGKKAW